MSNNAYFYATAAKVTSVDALHEQHIEYQEVGVAAYRIPVPWFFCFSAEDIYPYSQSCTNLAGESSDVCCYVAVVDTTTARQNIMLARELFTEFCGNTVVGDHFWQKALDDLNSVTMPYVMLEVSEIMFLNDLEEGAARFSRSFSRTVASFEDIAWFANYTPNTCPYPLGHLYQAVPDNDDERLQNTVALDMALNAPSAELNITITTEVSKAAAGKKKPWWRFW